MLEMVFTSDRKNSIYKPFILYVGQRITVACSENCRNAAQVEEEEQERKEETGRLHSQAPPGFRLVGARL